MQLTIKFFASVREEVGTDQCSVESTANDVGTLRVDLVRQFPGWSVVTSDKTLCAVNQTLCANNQLLKQGDEVAFFPFMTGG